MSKTNESVPALVDGLAVDITQVVDELELVEELLELDGKQILELGCGRANNTRAIAAAGSNRRIKAFEVDVRQHELNLQIDDLNNVTFALGGAERIHEEDASCDVVFLFKSLHHVPVECLERAMQEIARVLRPGGYAYVSEPLFRGEFNECLRLFHDESRERREAFGAILAAVIGGTLQSVSQTFFLSPVAFADFAEFEQMVIGATHSSHVLSDELLAEVRDKFASFAGTDGVTFEQPIRVDLLQRPV